MTPHQLLESRSPSVVADSILDSWLAGKPPDTLEALSEYPELKNNPSWVVNLAYEEFFIRCQAGETIDIDAFCARFPDYRTAIQEVLLADQVLREDPSRIPAVERNIKWPQPEELFGEYQIVRELGCGAFARVYLATIPRLGNRPVAIKVGESTSDEARTLGRLIHPNIVPVDRADWMEDHKLGVVCMPFLGTTTLASLLDTLYPKPQTPPPRFAQAILQAIAARTHPADPVPDIQLKGPNLASGSFVRGVCRLGAGIAEALDFLHKQKISHNDLKPANILLTPDGRPLLLDFNLARSATRDLNRLGGTFAYMPQESLQAFLEKKTPPLDTSREDVFALGVVLYMTLTGVHPFGFPPSGLSQNQLLTWVINRQRDGFVPLGKRNPQVFPSLARLVHRCLAFDPARRPADAGKIAKQLRAMGHPRSWLRLSLLTSALACSLALLMTPGPSPLVDVEPPLRVDFVTEKRTEGLKTLNLAWNYVAKQQVQNADPLLRESVTCFRSIIERHREAGMVPLGGWFDFYARGRAQMLLDDAEARHDFQQASDLWRRDVQLLVTSLVGTAQTPLTILSGLGSSHQLGSLNQGAKIAACQSWCYARSSDHQKALAMGELALNQSFRTPGLLALMAHSALSINRQDWAKQYITEALRREPEHLSARFSRIRFYLNAKLKRKINILPALVLEDLNWLMLKTEELKKLGLAEVHRQAGLAYAVSLMELQKQNSVNPAVQAKIREYEQRCQFHAISATTNGIPIRSILRDIMFLNALGPWLTEKNLSRVPGTKKSFNLDSHLVDPLTNLFG